MLFTSLAFAGDGGAYLSFVSGGRYIIAASRNAETTEIDGVRAWSVPTSGVYYINCKVDNDYLYDYGGISVIKVQYYDADDGKFCILYTNKEKTPLYSETVNLTGTNSWKTHSFRLSDCSYNDGILNSDFRITLQDKDGKSTSPVAFESVSVSVQPTVSCERTGHVFDSNEGAEIKVDIFNTGEAADYTVTAKVSNADGKLVKEESRTVLAKTGGSTDGSIVLKGLDCGFYSAEVSVTSGDRHSDDTVEFSIAKAVTRQNPNSIFGTCTHISGQKANSDKLNSMMYMLKKSGVDMIRDEYYWNHVELEKGKYTFYADDYVNACTENGIKPLIVLSYSNKFYGVPHDEDGYKAFAAYAAAVAEHLKGKADCFEVWNEWNSGTWNGGYGIEHYANILKYTYEALKAVDENITVVAGATITASAGWFDSLFSIKADGKSMFEYCDAISYHPYCFPMSPDSKKESGSVEDNFQKMYNMMRKYGTPKPQWITEYGWYTGSAAGNVSEEIQADYISRAYISGMAYGVEKIFMYDFKNDGIDKNESEHNYGIISSWDESEEISYKPKQSYLATAAAAQFLKNAKFVKEYRPKENIRMYKFEDGDREIWAVYTADNKTVPFLLTGGNLGMTCYDMFGNGCRIKEINGSPIYIEGRKGEFRTDGIMTEIRGMATATFGTGYKYDGIRVLGYKEPKTAGGRNAYEINPSDNKIVCDIDDFWAKTDGLKISIDYYDSGSGNFYISYRGKDGTMKRTELIMVGTSNTLKTAKFSTEGLTADNSMDGGDFIITTDSTSTISFIAVRAEEKNYGTPILSADFENSGFKNLNSITGNYSVQFDGIAVSAAANPNGKFKYVEKAGRYGVYVPAVDDGYYLQADIDDGILYGGLNDITVFVDYYDEGGGNFDIAVDKGKYSFQYPTGKVVYLQNTKTWKTAEFRIKDAWLENYGCDFRVALWTGWMTTSPEGITFGGIRVRNNTRIPAFNIDYDNSTKAVKISGYCTGNTTKPVSIQIIKPGKTAAEGIADVRYLAEAKASEDGSFSKDFKIDSETGEYLVRVWLPDSGKVSERYFYFYNLYDLKNITVRDKDGNVLDKDSIAGVDMINIESEFVSNYDDTELCVAAAIYGVDGVMHAVDFTETRVSAGKTSTAETEMVLSNKVQSGDKIKLFVFKNAELMTPLTSPRVVKVK